jgi:hypothetical protein
MLTPQGCNDINDVEVLRKRIALLEKALASALISVKKSAQLQQEHKELLHKLSFLTERNPLEDV